MMTLGKTDIGILQQRFGTRAAFIVRACNAHEDLVSKLEMCCGAIEGFAREADEKPRNQIQVQILLEMVKRARAALATARGAGSEDNKETD